MVLARLLDELPERNRDNVSRTASYLELYAWTRAHGPELPWLLMAHLVSRNAGYLMSDLARTLGKLEAQAQPGIPPDSVRELFRFLERANHLIFWDAWHHVLARLLGRPLDPRRTSRFMREAWARRPDLPDGSRDPDGERALVLDLVHNEQHFIERRVVHAERFEQARRMIAFLEMAGREKAIALPPVAGAEAIAIKVGGFAAIDRRITTGRRLYDEVLADRARRDALFAWATAHPHTGDRSVYGAPATAPVREAWPLDKVRALDPAIHDDAEPDPEYP